MKSNSHPTPIRPARTIKQSGEEKKEWLITPILRGTHNKAIVFLVPKYLPRLMCLLLESSFISIELLMEMANLGLDHRLVLWVELGRSTCLQPCIDNKTTR